MFEPMDIRQSTWPIATKDENLVMYVGELCALADKACPVGPNEQVASSYPDIASPFT